MWSRARDTQAAQLAASAVLERDFSCDVSFHRGRVFVVGELVLVVLTWDARGVGRASRVPVETRSCWRGDLCDCKQSGVI